MNIARVSESDYEFSPALQNRDLVIGLIAVSLALFFLMWISVATDSLFVVLDEPVNRFFAQVHAAAPAWVDAVGVAWTAFALTAVDWVWLTARYRRRFPHGL